MNLKTVAFGIILVTSIAGAPQRNGRIVRRRPKNGGIRGGKAFAKNIRQSNSIQPIFSASEPLPPQFSPTLSQPNAANSPQNFVPEEANQNERQGFAFENSLPPQFSSFPPSDGGNGQIGQEQFNNPGPFQNIEEVSSPFSSDFSSEFEAGPTGESDFEISGPTLASSSLLTNAGLELTPDNFDRDENVNQNPRDLFSDDTPITGTGRPLNTGFQDNGIRDRGFNPKGNPNKKSSLRKGAGRNKSLSRSSALRKDGRAGPLVAAKRGPQFTGGQDRQDGQSRRGQRDFGQDDSIGGEEDGTAEYNFAYEVNSDEGAQFSQQEEASGGVITGEYRVNLPDGRVQIVRYSASAETGFVAEVTYEGEAQYPDTRRR